MKSFKEFLNKQSLITEMVRLNKGIEVRNDGKNKFSHFHWNGVHFNLFEEIPDSIEELKERIHFKKERDKLKDNELKELLKILNSPSTQKRGKIYKNVYEFTVAIWEILNERDVDDKY